MAKKRIVVLTGAGMSAESGLKTFRDSGGLWEEYAIEDVCTPMAWDRNPALVLEFYNKRREQLLTAEPNKGHQGLALLEEDYDVQIVTQNVDNLHEKAGSLNVLHLHGELMKVRSTGDESLIYKLEGDSWQVNIGDNCEKGFQLRPHIVFFGEAVPAIEEAIPICESADAFVVIGTSMNVYPAAGLINYVRRGTPIFVVDPYEVPIPAGLNVDHILKGAEEGVEILKQKLDEKFLS